MHVKRASMGSGFMEFSVREIDTQALSAPSAVSTHGRVALAGRNFSTATPEQRDREHGDPISA
jgi:hypothetical protein